MHAHIVQDHAGSCPICGMDLVVVDDEPVSDTQPDEIAQVSDNNSLWVCPMHAHIAQDHAGSCPICGMDLVPADHDNTAVDSGIRIDTATTQKMGVRLAEVQEQPLHLEIHTVGEIRLDQDSLLDITPKIDGWIKRLGIRYAGQRVRKGDLLYEIYSPELVQRQREYIELLHRRDQLLESMNKIVGQNAQLLASLARERIRFREKFAYADVGYKVLETLDATRRTVDYMPVHAPQSGYVVELNTSTGRYVTPSTTLLSIADLSRVWIDFALYPDQLAWVQAGDSVQVRLQTDRPRTVRGHIEFVNPVTDTPSQTRTARIIVDNPDELLSPGMFVDVVISTATRQVVAVPRSAIMHTGQGDRVMLSRGDGHFMPVPVVTGLQTRDYVEISDGLQEGAQVAVNGQYLLDAAASLHDTLQRMKSVD